MEFPVLYIRVFDNIEENNAKKFGRKPKRAENQRGSGPQRGAGARRTEAPCVAPTGKPMATAVWPDASRA